MLRISVLPIPGQFNGSVMDGVLCWRMVVCDMAGMRPPSSEQIGRNGAKREFLRADSGTDIGQQSILDSRNKTAIPRGWRLSPAGPVGHAPGNSVWRLQYGDAKPGIYTMEVAGILWHHDIIVVLCRDDRLPQESHPRGTDDISGLAVAGVRRKAQPSGHTECECRSGTAY